MMKYKNINYEIVRSGRKSIALEITRDMRVIVRVPYLMRDNDIKRFIDEKSSWLEEHIEIMQQKSKMAEPQTEAAPKFSTEEIRRLAERALIVIPERAAYYAPIVGVRYGRITIRNQVSRWGSCSNLGNLNFNCLLMLVPPDVIDYVVVHELCHRKELNHSARFWDEVGRVLPDFAASRKWLKDNGTALIQRLR